MLVPDKPSEVLDVNDDANPVLCADPRSADGAVAAEAVALVVNPP
ncbi:hypothetical protein [Nocardia alni]|nr:hypothetical protein [Nocardia alni]